MWNHRILNNCCTLLNQASVSCAVEPSLPVLARRMPLPRANFGEKVLYVQVKFDRNAGSKGAGCETPQGIAIGKQVAQASLCEPGGKGCSAEGWSGNKRERVLSDEGHIFSGDRVVPYLGCISSDTDRI